MKRKVASHDHVIQLTILLQQHKAALDGLTYNEVSTFLQKRAEGANFTEAAVRKVAKQVGITFKIKQTPRVRRNDRVRHLAMLLYDVVKEIEAVVELTGDDRIGIKSGLRDELIYASRESGDRDNYVPTLEEEQQHEEDQQQEKAAASQPPAATTSNSHTFTPPNRRSRR